MTHIIAFAEREKRTLIVFLSLEWKNRSQQIFPAMETFAYLQAVNISRYVAHRKLKMRQVVVRGDAIRSWCNIPNHKCPAVKLWANICRIGRYVSIRVAGNISSPKHFRELGKKNGSTSSAYQITAIWCPCDSVVEEQLAKIKSSGSQIGSKASSRCETHTISAVQTVSLTTRNFLYIFDRTYHSVNTLDSIGFWFGKILHNAIKATKDKPFRRFRSFPTETAFRQC